MTKKTGYLGGTITVTTNVTGVAIKVSTGSSVVATTTTASSGAVLTNIPVGTYEVEVSADGYVTKTEIVTVDGDKNVSFKLVEKATVDSVVAVDNKKLYVEGKNLDQIKAENVKVGAKTATELSDVESVELRKDGSLFIVTKGMTAGTAYTVQIAGQTFTAIAKPADSDALTVNTVTAKSSTLVEVAFNEDDADKLTLLDKDNYVFDNGLKATDVTYKYDENGDKVLGTVYVSTTVQTAGQVYELTINGVSDLAGNVIKKDTKKTFAGIAEDKTAPTLVSVTSSKGNKVTVTFDDDSMMDAESLSNIANYTISGLEVKKATVVTNELTGGNAVVTLETSQQTVGTVYTLKADKIKDLYGNTPTKALELTFAGTALDTTAPSVSTVTAQTNTTVSVVFDDEMDVETATNVANYAIDNGLSIVSAKLNTDKKSANYMKEVVLTTTAQTVGTVYEVTVSNVKDAAGNAITTSQTYKKTFAGVGVDTTAPTVSVYTAGTAVKNKVTLQFSEAVDEKTAKEPTNYKIEGLGYPTAVSFDATNNRVTLTTAVQSNGSIYKITINNIADKAGNVIKKDTEVKFAGIGNAAEAAKVASVVALNNRQIKVTFNKDVQINGTDANTYFTLKDKDDSAVNITQSSTKTLYKVDGKTYIITTEAAELTNQIYTLTAKTTAINDLGNVALSSADTADYTKTFGGVTADVKAPKVVAVTQLSGKKLEVTFDQDLDETTNAIDASKFTINYTDDSLADTAGTITATAKGNKVVITTAAILAKNAVATLEITPASSGVKDKTGNFLIEVSTGKTTHNFGFATTNYTASTVKLSSATSVDEQTLILAFNQDVASTLGTSDISITNEDGTPVAAGVPTIKKVSKVDGSDSKLKVSFAGTLESGKLYKVTIDNSKVTDIDGAAMSTATADKSATFGANTAENAAPELISAIPLSETTIQIAFSEGILNNGSALNVATPFTLTNKTTGATADLTGATLTQIDKDGAVYTLKVANGTFVQGNTYELKILAAGNLTDTNGVDALKVTNDDGTAVAVDFGGVGTIAPAAISSPLASGFTATYDRDLYTLAIGVLTAVTTVDNQAEFETDATGTLVANTTSGAKTVAFSGLTATNGNKITNANGAESGLYDALGNLVTGTYTFDGTNWK